MNIRTIAASAGLLLSFLATPSWAQAPTESPQGNTLIDIAGHTVPVPKGGLYDRFRSNPPLAVIQAEAPDTDLSWFKELKKTKVNMGFESHSPNFYYQNSRVTAIFTADLQRLKTLMPEAVLKEVQPLQVWPGRGLVAITAYAYQLCDNDSYNEVAISIVTNRPGGGNWGPLTLLGQAMSKDYWGYVLKLPVNTELARVRGVVGYNLPKWLTGIHVKAHEKSLAFEIIDGATGKTDVVLEGQKLSELSDKVEMVKNSFTNLDATGRLMSGHALSRQLRHASSSRSDAVSLQLSDGSLSAFIKSLNLGRMVKYEYVPSFQSALYAPEPLSLIAEHR
ncbi:acetoacetate decarboxylase (ADC) [Aquabacterium sp.]|uniref:acetoacetate decarboxylase (ADC) n=1 Tax=Aquabacterium sp. TaxID=1872578 RepID=UPI0025B9708F|nr:acetoacetate decarboxylase (ADC) [Aquabacterium sp.]